MGDCVGRELGKEIAHMMDRDPLLVRMDEKVTRTHENVALILRRMDEFERLAVPILGALRLVEKVSDWWVR